MKILNLCNTISDTFKFDDGKVVLINTSDIGDGKIKNHVEVSSEKVAGQFKKKFKNNDILFSEIRPKNKRIALIGEGDFTNYVASTKLMVIRKNSDKVYWPYFYIYISNDFFLNKLQIIAESRSGTFPQITFNEFGNIEINLPSLEEQKQIADRISVYDDKIENNNKIIKVLEDKASLLYKRYFIDFEFPDSNGLPYKSNGGEFKESEMGMIPIEWEVKILSDYSEIVTGKKNANAANENGKYKFFTCSQNDFLTDEYCFEGDAILVAGNGDFSVKKYSGKFDAYQRTYVLIPKKSIDVDWLFWHVKINLDAITSGHRGSVIKFITKGMLADEKVVESNNIKIKNEFKIMNDLIQGIKIENEVLVKKRDLLIRELIK